jgi:hypothetical protein
MANATGQNAIQMPAVAGPSGGQIRQTSAPAGNNLPAATKLIRLDGVAQNGVHAYTSFALALPSLQGGDIVEFQATSAGGSDTFSAASGNYIDLQNLAFSAGAPLIIRARLGDSIRITCPGVSININNCSYITFDFSNAASMKIGDSDLSWVWSSSNPSGLPNSSQANGMCVGGGSHHLRFLGGGWSASSPPGTGETICYGGRNYNANVVDGSCSMIYFANWEFYLSGNNHWFNTTQNQWLNGGNLFEMGANKHLLKNVRISVGGHDAFSWDGPNGILDGVYIANDWRPFNTGFAGCRCSSVQDNWRSGLGTPTAGSGGNSNSQFGAPFGPCLAINSVWQDSAPAGGVGVDLVTTKMSGYALVVLGCYFLDTPAGWAFHIEFLGENATSGQEASLLRNAHCTYLNLGGLLRIIDLPNNSSDSMPPTDFEAHYLGVNSLCYQMNGSTIALGAMFVGWQSGSSGKAVLNQSAFYGGGTWRNFFKGARIGPALIVPIASPPTGWDTIQLFTGPNSGSAAFDSPLAAWSSNDVTGYPNVAASGNQWANVRCTSGTGATAYSFTSLGSPPNRQIGGLSLVSGSAGRTAAKPIAQVTASGTSVTTVHVDEPSWFPADLVQVDTFIPEFQNYYPYVGFGSTLSGANGLIARVTAIDRVNKTITVTPAVTVTNGWGVWIAGFAPAGASFSTVWQNFGANQT